MASAIGGYLAARLRTKWAGVNTNEVFFRDTAHGLITWAFATVLSASVLGAAVTHIVGGVGGGRRSRGRAGRAEREPFARVRRPAVPNRRGSAAGFPCVRQRCARRSDAALDLHLQLQAVTLSRRTGPTSLV